MYWPPIVWKIFCSGSSPAPRAPNLRGLTCRVTKTYLQNKLYYKWPIYTHNYAINNSLAIIQHIYKQLKSHDTQNVFITKLI
jgi:hypothetical protein